MRSPSFGSREERSSISSRTVWPDASTSRSPPASSRRTGGTRITLTALAARAPMNHASRPAWQISNPTKRVAWSSRAELDVVDVLGDRRGVAADRAARVALHVHLAEVGRERIDQEQPTDQRLADPEREVERLVRLQRADDA